MPNRETAPFLWDVGARVLKGTAIGLLAGMLFFKSARTRKFCAFYGAGFGLGMNYTQFDFLYQKMMGTPKSR